VIDESGHGNATGPTWTDNSSTAAPTVSCAKALRIYCFEQP